MGLMETVIDIPAEHEANVFGQFDVENRTGSSCNTDRER